MEKPSYHIYKATNQTKQMSLQPTLTDFDIDLSIDATGLNCPLPILKARKGLMQLTSGQLIKVQATDPASAEDFPTFCQQTGNELVFSEIVENIYTFVVRAK